ncbi:hypothetical protein KK062_29395 [Fulvivirgaceae bacterium PWU5]|uniref:Uncharacterized protein n=1 Tax=Dawidia cretensis TaxID=2782350 RepID=A0AAP2GWF3_9BACT|nr:hypothetical protein [Dawidia cretensis]MBT1712393.1 hypothetical protein [Dawidia cretensis]
MEVLDFEALQKLDKNEIIQRYQKLVKFLEEVRRDLIDSKELLFHVVRESERLRLKVPDIKQSEYNQKWSWTNKIVFVLSKIKRPLLSSEIINFIRPHEVSLQYSRTPAQALSPHIHKAVKYGRILRYKLGGTRGFYYVLPAWLDPDGKIIEEYGSKILF